ncbi:2-polyprenyl-6-methoxyphenol hydroxylase-like oxidoreductase [Mycobacterium sp. ITM-2016-00317]|uniref:FAD-dependent oxidoreductase n=1 Tax=Mycobacterium sp. ITM-2016-00317 TaxID=2099694 RepID=UPI00287FDB2D|nr:2-polyprenyl-6-methoxyphenol hydroxylase-like oxidoreductase [Mycobacterium sp. ITM-2016-00317]WNG88291.1 2-polyprenyl-6-methoxyphenol hydroxylase-like oxidoreductase [Mycobacterium sp. ITM-2016-00317]
MTHRGGHAVVLGAGIGGLLTARVLTDFYDRVTVLERDALDAAATTQRGMPRSRQPHMVPARCGQIVEELFPGVTEEMVAAGAHLWADGDLSRMYTRVGGRPVTRLGPLPDLSGPAVLFAGRPFVEGHVLSRVRTLPGVAVLDRHDAGPLMWRGEVVTGVQAAGGRGTQDLPADLVVDATGRGSRTPAFLECLGYRRPPEERLTVHANYVSMPVRIPDGLLHELMFLDMLTRSRPLGFIMSRCENDQWNMLVGTRGSNAAAAPASVAEMFRCAEQLMPPHAVGALRTAEPLGDVALHRFPGSMWRRYDKLDRVPRGLLVTGEAVCSISPIYGQGMTVAALCAVTLRECLRRGEHLPPRHFHRAAAKRVKRPWRRAVVSDRPDPESEGLQPFPAGMIAAMA